MNIEEEINKIINDDQIDYSEDYADCLELMVRLRSLDENDMEYNHIYEEFSKAFSKLNSEEQKNIRKVYELDDAIFEEIAKSDDLQYDYDLKNKISKIASSLPIEYTKYFIDILPRDYYIYSFAFVVASNLIKLYKKDRDFALQVLKELINIDLKVNAYKYYQELENLDLVTTDGLKNLTRNIKRRCK